MRFSCVLYGRTRSRCQRPSRPCTSRSRTLMLSITSSTIVSRSSTPTLSLMSLIGRPMSAAMRLKVLSAGGVKRRMRRSAPRITIGTSELASRLVRSLLLCESSRLRLCSSSLTVASSSFDDWISSLEVSSSSLMLCSSSLVLCTSSFAACSSSFTACCCSITDCRYSRVAPSSCFRRVISRPLVPSAGGVAAAALVSASSWCALASMRCAVSSKSSR